MIDGSFSTGLWGQVNTVSLGKHSVHIGHLTLELSTGDITKETTDVIVNSSNATFSLKSGKFIVFNQNKIK